MAFHAMALDNDTRGWIMTALSGLACILGAAIIFVDIPIRRIPRFRNFRIEESNTFSTCSLSLSFGVMIFSALYKMLPSSKDNLISGGLSKRVAAWVLICCFLAGAGGIQIVSNICHGYMPSHVVECDHSHDKEGEDSADVSHHHHHHHDHPQQQHGADHGHHSHASHSHHSHQQSSLSSHSHTRYGTMPSSTPSQQTSTTASTAEPQTLRVLNNNDAASALRRPSIQRLKSVASTLFQGHRQDCDPERGQCYGTSELCPKECFEIIQSRRPSLQPVGTTRPAMSARTVSEVGPRNGERQRLLSVSENTPLNVPRSQPSEAPVEGRDMFASDSSDTIYDPEFNLSKSNSAEEDDTHHTHHHHVPDNNFLAIGLQTSIAIALHKLPEGFITFATNHANPKLGLSVFLALFVHNITEGFALSLPIYLALHSRTKAIIWSFFLGGCSQPIGAGIAALWFHLAGSGDSAPGEVVYGVMFAITAGIMACVGCHIFSEAMGLTHRRGLCLAFAFLGMGILGVSSALTA